MSSPRPSGQSLSFQQLVKSTDEELLEIILDLPWDNDNFWYSPPLELDGTSGPPGRAERRQLGKRLSGLRKRAFAPPLPITKERNEFARRLRLICLGHGYPRFEESSLPTTTATDQDQRIKEWERIAYKRILELGGRPVYPIHRLDEIIEKVPVCGTLLMLRPWVHLAHLVLFVPDCLLKWQTFCVQLKNWERFRAWQRDHRGTNDQYTYAEFVQELHRDSWMVKQDTRHLEWCELVEEDPMILWEKWETRAHEWAAYREPGCGGFADYCEAVRRRLESHEFIQPFQLHQDPKQQDPLTTWIEYLYYEYWWLDHYTAALDSSQQKLKEEWAKAQSNNLFGPREVALGGAVKQYKGHRVDQSLHFFSLDLRLRTVADKACEASDALRSANSALEDAQAKAKRQQTKKELSKSETSSALDAVQELLAARDKAKADHVRAMDRMKAFSSLCEHNDETCAQNKAIESQKLLVDWALSELRLVEDEVRKLPGAADIPMIAAKLERKRVRFSEAEPSIFFRSTDDCVSTYEGEESDHEMETDHQAKRLRLSLDEHPGRPGSQSGFTRLASGSGEQDVASVASDGAGEPDEQTAGNCQQEGMAKQSRLGARSRQARGARPARPSARTAASMPHAQQDENSSRASRSSPARGSHKLRGSLFVRRNTRAAAKSSLAKKSSEAPAGSQLLRRSARVIALQQTGQRDEGRP